MNEEIGNRSGLSAEGKLEKQQEKAIREYALRIIGKWTSNRSLAEEEIKKDVNKNLLSKEEINEIIRKLPKEEIERIKKDLMEMQVELSNKNIAAYYFHENEIKTTWLVNAAYGILTRNEVRAAIPSQEAEREIKETIEKCIREKKPIHLVGFCGGYKESKDRNVDLADIKALDRIKEEINKLKSIGVDADVKIYLADIHAISPLMGRSLKLVVSSTNYLSQIKQLCTERGFECKSIAKSFFGFSVKEYKLAHEHGKDMHYDYEFKEEITRRAKEFWQNLDKEINATIIEAAEKHVTENVDKEKAALGYIGQRLFEKEWLEVEEDTIFFSYGSKHLAPLLPMKTIFWHSVGRLSNLPRYMEMKSEGKEEKK